MRVSYLVLLLLTLLGCSDYSIKEGEYIKENVPKSYYSPDRYRSHNNAGGLDK